MEWAIPQLQRDLIKMGLGDNADIILKYDNESAIKELARVLGECRKGRTVPEKPRMRNSQSNGFIERAVQEVEGLVRTLKLGL